MIKSNRKFLLGLAGLLVGGVVVLAGIQLGWFGGNEPIAGPEIPQDNEQVELSRNAEHKPLSDALGVENDDLVVVGGVKRPKRDLTDQKIDLVAARKRYLASLNDPGRAPAVKSDVNPQVTKLSTELQSGPGPRGF